MPTIAILHFSPLELYPPVQNLLRSLMVGDDRHYYIYTTKNCVPELSTFTLSGDNITIKRYGRSGNELSSLARWIGYCFFHAGTFLHMLATKPAKILYYETLSFLPVYLYKTWVNKYAAVWAHYHEYTSREEYLAGMKLSRHFHEMEQQVYTQMDGVSHTNAERLAMFLDDIAPAKPRSAVAIPNFPPPLMGQR